jgi:uncharacterized protein
MVGKGLKSSCTEVGLLNVNLLRSAVVCTRLVTRCLATLAALCVGSAFFQPSFVSAQPAAAPSQEQIARMAIPKGALFKATKDGKTVHLFGTMHVGSQTTLPLGRQVIASVIESQALLLELDFSDPKLAAEFDKYSAAKKPVNLTAPQREAALNAAKIMNIPAEKMLNLRPMMLVAMVSMAQGHAIGLAAEYGADLFLFGVALGARIPVVGMETVQDQLKMEDELNEFELDQMVQEAFDDIESKRAIKVLYEMSEAWIKGDLDELARVSEITKNSVSKKFLIASNKRNYVMVEKIVAASSTAMKPVFAAAGALHFWGDESIQNLLKKRGYQIVRIH